MMMLVFGVRPLPTCWCLSFKALENIKPCDHLFRTEPTIEALLPLRQARFTRYSRINTNRW